MDNAHRVGETHDELADRATGAIATIPDYSTLGPARPPTPMGVVAVVAVKIVGLYCFVQALPLLYAVPAALILMFSGRGYDFVSGILNFLYPAVYLLAGVFLVRRATWVATRVLGFAEPAGDSEPRSPGRRLQAIAFSVVGIWLVIGGLVDAVDLFVQAHSDARLSGGDVIQTAFAEPSELVATAVQLALGVGLFFGSKRLADFWHRFRTPSAVRRPEPIE